MNDRFGNISGIASVTVLRMQGNSAAALAAPAKVRFVPRLGCPTWTQRKCGSGDGQKSACERPVRRLMSRRRDLHAATANKCCVSKERKTNDGIVRKADIVTPLNEQLLLVVF
ncbi:hypothetical protein [Litoreibacter arenae]|uniref:hypothetical protein n=1 Tax=Litoreibacter arenae TaxID=491388 RepID=UPI00147035AD|nr:hypothetical protein [Litoreibacter arenae]